MKADAGLVPPARSRPFGEVLQAPIVFVVEGEKDVETLRDYGFVATTNAGGAEAPWLPQFTQALRGREVILLPDNDGPGRKRVLNIARALLGKVARLLGSFLNTTCWLFRFWIRRAACKESSRLTISWALLNARPARTSKRSA